jgi:uncharacterized protein YjeT (DUF2065 family)
MNIKRYSMMYLATYLSCAGLGFLLMPTLATRLLLSNTTYEEVPMRIAGLFALLLAIVVIQIVRHKIEVLYPTSVVARCIALVVLVALYFQTHNPLFITLFVIVFVGVASMMIGLWKSHTEFKI